MLIWLDESILSADLSKEVDACHGIENLFGAAHRGEHFVACDRKTLQALQQNQCLSAASKITATKILAEAATNIAFARTIRTKAIITHNREIAIKKKATGAIEVPLVNIGKNGLARTILLCENLDDAILFEQAALQHKVQHKLMGEVSIEKLGGGGSTTPGCFANLINTENKWVLCISDSDRLHPADNMDQTAQKCEELGSMLGRVSHFHDIRSRETENIIPLNFLSEAVPQTHLYQWERHTKFVFNISQDIHKFGDLKKGTSIAKVFTYQANTPERVFWDSSIKSLIDGGYLTSNCHDKEYCLAQAKSDSCNCMIVHGYGDKLLQTVNNKLKSRSPQKSVEAIKKDPNTQIWQEIGELVFEWGCAQPRMRA
jgi:hypothetical protein